MRFIILFFIIFIFKATSSQIVETQSCKIDFHAELGRFPYAVDYLIALDTNKGFIITFEKSIDQKDYILYHFNQACHLDDSIKVYSPSGVHRLTIDAVNNIQIITNDKAKYEFPMELKSINIQKKGALKYKRTPSNSFEADTFVNKDSTMVIIRKGQLDAIPKSASRNFHMSYSNIIPYYTKILYFDSSQIIFQFGVEGVFLYTINTTKLTPISIPYAIAAEKLHWDFSSNSKCNFLVGVEGIEQQQLLIKKYIISK